MAQKIAKAAREASLLLQASSESGRNSVLSSLQQKLKDGIESLRVQNQQDLTKAKDEASKGNLNQNLVKRLDLFGKDDSKFNDMLKGISDVISMPDPIGKISLASKVADGLELRRVSCPIGTLLIIFESRPEVLIQIASLAIKSGNAVILKGGKEAAGTLECLNQIIRDALQSVNDPNIIQNAVQLIFNRDQVAELLKMDDYIDLVIPRGSKDLVSYVKNNTRVAVLGHADGLCSVFVDESADYDKAVRIIIDSKTHYPAACNACETLLVHRKFADRNLKQLVQQLIAAKIEVRMDQIGRSLLQSGSTDDAMQMKESNDEDYRTEFLDLVLAVKIVDSIDEAIKHVNSHGSKHTDCIISESKESYDKYFKYVDAAGVYWNASTRFADGFRYGFGAEIGISTSKIHARGPVALEGLMIYKYKMVGNGHVAADFADGGRYTYLHQALPY
ncbi:hypothetical protein MP228_000970 [Amoeboaphelidium protococcarum]|nr:hypothetical protein MP228_000970 [Amoeboaphelidium protococcarum]